MLPIVGEMRVSGWSEKEVVREVALLDDAD
jgi:hypothetical protein